MSDDTEALERYNEEQAAQFEAEQAPDPFDVDTPAPPPRAQRYCPTAYGGMQRNGSGQFVRLDDLQSALRLALEARDGYKQLVELAIRYGVAGVEP